MWCCGGRRDESRGGFGRLVDLIEIVADGRLAVECHLSVHLPAEKGDEGENEASCTIVANVCFAAEVRGTSAEMKVGRCTMRKKQAQRECTSSSTPLRWTILTAQSPQQAILGLDPDPSARSSCNCFVPKKARLHEELAKGSTVAGQAEEALVGWLGWRRNRR